MKAWQILALLFVLGCSGVRAGEPVAAVPAPKIVVISEKGGRQSGSIAYRKGLSLMQAIVAMGGITEFGGGTTVYLIRGGKPEKMDIGNASKDTLLEPWDIILLK